MITHDIARLIALLVAGGGVSISYPAGAPAFSMESVASQERQALPPDKGWKFFWVLRVKEDIFVMK